MCVCRWRGSHHFGGVERLGIPSAMPCSDFLNSPARGMRAWSDSSRSRSSRKRASSLASECAFRAAGQVVSSSHVVGSGLLEVAQDRLRRMLASASSPCRRGARAARECGNCFSMRPVATQPHAMDRRIRGVSNRFMGAQSTPPPWQLGCGATSSGVDTACNPAPQGFVRRCRIHACQTP